MTLRLMNIHKLDRSIKIYFYIFYQFCEYVIIWPISRHFCKHLIKWYELQDWIKCVILVFCNSKKIKPRKYDRSMISNLVTQIFKGKGKGKKKPSELCGYFKKNNIHGSFINNICINFVSPVSKHFPSFLFWGEH